MNPPELRGVVTVTDLVLLLALYKKDLTNEEICAILKVKYPLHWPYIKRLRKKGYCETENTGSGKRVFFLITDKGRKLLEEIRDSIS